MTILNLSITDDADDGHETGGTWETRTSVYSTGEFFQVRRSGGATTHHGGLRFQGVTIPQGSTINSATLTVVGREPTSIDATNSVLLVVGDDVDNSGAIGASHRPTSGWTDTTATATKNGLAAGDNTIDVTSIVQEIVNRAGWSSGNAISFRLGTSGSDTYWYLNIYDYDADTLANVATLDIDYGAAAVKKLKLLLHPDAQGDGSIAGAVFATPSGGDITGAKIGEFTGKTFEATLESGQAVLKVPVADFGGGSLTTSDTPVAIVRNSTDTSGVIAGTVIEE